MTLSHDAILAPPRAGARTLGKPARAVLSGIVGAQATALGALPWSTADGLLLATLIALPFTLAVSSALLVLVGPRSVRVLTNRLALTAVVVGLPMFLIFVCGAYLANVLLVDAALQRRTLVGYGLSAGVALLGGLVLARARHLLDPIRLARAGLIGLPALLCVIDATFLTHGYEWFHLGILALTLFLFTTGATLWVSDVPRAKYWAVGAIAVLTLSAIPWLGSRPVEDSYWSVLQNATAHQRLLLLARHATDRDGDGFSAWLGGGDCDDEDARAFPLSTKGRDCLHWLDNARVIAPFVPASLDGRPPSQAIPKVIVLLTVDAFRCGFGRDEVPELVDACPRLKQLGERGQLRVDAHTTFPSTGQAMLSLHSAVVSPRKRGGDQFRLATAMRELGRETHAIVTHARQFGSAISPGFMSVDNSLRARAAQPSESTAEETTSLVLQKVRQHLDVNAPPVFIWAHYYDPHAPYVDVVGSPWAFGEPVARYAVEVRRTDAAIGRLADELEVLGEPSALLFMTADHGEEFGEKGKTYHGASLNEGAVRVPMVAWSPNSRHLRELPKSLPASLAEVAPYLLAVAGRGTFDSRNEAFFAVGGDAGSIGLYTDGWKVVHHRLLGRTELFHVATDPREERDLAPYERARLRELTARLADYVKSSSLE